MTNCAIFARPWLPRNNAFPANLSTNSPVSSVRAMRTDTGTPERTVHGSNVTAGLCPMRQSSGMLSFMFRCNVLN